MRPARRVLRYGAPSWAGWWTARLADSISEELNLLLDAYRVSRGNGERMPESCPAPAPHFKAALQGAAFFVTA